MKYELWDLADDGMEIRPLSLLFETDSFQEVYLRFVEQVKTQHATTTLKQEQRN